VATVLVTGGRGYIGRHIVRQLVGRGDRVVSYDRDYAEPSDGAESVQGELFDVPRLVEALRTAAAEAIIHTAAMSHPTLSVDFPIATVAANIDGTVGVFEAARSLGLRRIVNFSSECAYGRVDGPVSEDTPRRPTTPYGVTKVAMELMGDVYNSLYDMQIVSLRPTEVYGPGNRMPQYICQLIRTCLDGKPYRLESGGDHRFHFVRVEDVAAAAVCALDAKSPSRSTYNITGGSQITFAAAADLAATAIPGASIEIGPGELELDAMGLMDISAAARDLGYTPAWPVKLGIPDYVEWLRVHEF
jgi:UDP-glucose 4-epimerase